MRVTATAAILAASLTAFLLPTPAQALEAKVFNLYDGEALDSEITWRSRVGDGTFVRTTLEPFSEGRGFRYQARVENWHALAHHGCSGVLFLNEQRHVVAVESTRQMVDSGLVSFGGPAVSTRTKTIQLSPAQMRQAKHVRIVHDRCDDSPDFPAQIRRGLEFVEEFFPGSSR